MAYLNDILGLLSLRDRYGLERGQLDLGREQLSQQAKQFQDTLGLSRDESLRAAQQWQQQFGEAQLKRQFEQQQQEEAERRAQEAFRRQQQQQEFVNSQNMFAQARQQLAPLRTEAMRRDNIFRETPPLDWGSFFGLHTPTYRGSRG